MAKNTQQPRYAAFISYRHKTPDRQIARALQFLLEHNLVRPDRKAPRRIRPVFLDTSELPTLEDLDAGILDALDRSDCLYVICSPSLPLSKYCMQEIRYFKARHGGSLDRIYTLLVDGTPEESFPRLLRTKIRRFVDPQGMVWEQEVETEPLFADVRGKTLLQRLWKLWHKEYIRLAAAYFRCSFDRLYKRQQRWCVSVISCVLAAVLAGGWGLHTYTGRMEADSVAVQVTDALQQGDTLSALALCADAGSGTSDSFEAALRSAAVQHHYQTHALPISAMLLNTYQESGATARYLSREGNQLLIHSSTPTGHDRILQITDAATGQIHLKEAQDRVFVVGDQPAAYLILRSHEDEQGVMRDYVSLMDLRDNSLIREFSYRESSRDSVSYRLVQAIERKDLLVVWDKEEAVAFLTTEGVQLTEEEFVALAQAHVNDALPEENHPYTLARSRRQYLLKDAAGEKLLELKLSEVSAFDFSEDWKLFAWVEGGTIHIYDLETKSLIAESPYTLGEQSKLRLLGSSGGYAAMTLGDGTQYTHIFDWKTGKRLMELEGIPLFSDTQHAFFTVTGGQVTRYDYQALDVARSAAVIHTTGERCLTYGSGWVTLLDAESGKVLLESRAELPAWDGTLDHILVKEAAGLSCYDGTGNRLWTASAEAACIGMSYDGTAAAWTDAEGRLMLADAATGESRQLTVLRDIGPVAQLAVTEYGVCAVGEAETVYFSNRGTELFRKEGYTAALTYSDGLLFLQDEWARVRDYLVLDAKTGGTFYQPANNTRSTVYSPASGILVRHVEESDNNATLQLEILRRGKNGFNQVATVDLPVNAVEHMYLDTTGQWLSVTSGGRTVVYFLKTMEVWVDAEGAFFYESGTLYGTTAYGSYVYQFTPTDVQDLQNYARTALTSAWGTRTSDTAPTGTA